MFRRPNADDVLALLTAGSFLATISLLIVASLDALDGSPSSACELALATLGGAAFASMLASESARGHERSSEERP